MAERLTRDQVPVEQTWNLGDIYATPQDWAADLERIDQDIHAVSAYKGRLDEGAETLLDCLRARDALLTRLDHLHGYAHLAFAADGNSPANQAVVGQANALAARVDAAGSFLRTELLALPDGRIEHYLATEPGLEAFRVLLEAALRQRGHLLHPDTEEALAALGETLSVPYSIWQIATAVDMTCAPIHDVAGNEIPVSISSYFVWQSQSPYRAIRRDSFQSLTAGLGQRKATLATALATHIKQNVTLARLRRYDSATEMILAGQQVPAPVYHNVLDVVHDEIAPHARRLMRLRARLIGVEQLQRYDLEAPVDPDFAPTTSFAEGARLIQEAVRPLGEEYGSIIAASFRDRWIDRADNVGKRSGAFCGTVYGVHPYVFTTWQDSLRSVFTLAHELGHAGHGAFETRHHNISTLEATTSIFMVEAPSTANEMFLGQYLLDATTDPRMRRWVILQLLRTFTHNMVTHLLEGHFERRLYQLAEAGKPLTLDTIMEVQGEVFERFFAGTVAVDDSARLYWAQQPHFYVNLYPYTYAAGLACGYAVAGAIRDEGQPAVDRWLRMLSLGNSRPPLELLRIAGVDMTSAEPLRQAVRYFGTLVDELEQSPGR